MNAQIFKNMTAHKLLGQRLEILLKNRFPFLADMNGPSESHVGTSPFSDKANFTEHKLSNLMLMGKFISYRDVSTFYFAYLFD